MAYREKDTKKWTAQWFETNVMGEKKKRRKRGFETGNRMKSGKHIRWMTKPQEIKTTK